MIPFSKTSDLSISSRKWTPETLELLHWWFTGDDLLLLPGAKVFQSKAGNGSNGDLGGDGFFSRFSEKPEDPEDR